MHEDHGQLRTSLRTSKHLQWQSGNAPIIPISAAEENWVLWRQLGAAEVN